jgi:long-chain acyl-CoA synthetase
MTAHGIAAIAAEQPTRPAIVMGPTRMTYGDLDARINRLARRLAGLGVGPGDRVAVMLRNRPEVFVAWNAVARLGAVAVPVGYRLAETEVRYLVDDSGAVAFVHEADFPASPVDGVAALRGVVDVDEVSLDDGPAGPPTDDYLGAAVVPMTYTSGTTGRPKGIERAAPAPARTATPNPVAQFWGFTADDVHLLCGPAYHTAPGMYAQMHLSLGARIVIMEPFDAEHCLSLIETELVTTSHMVPANFVRILEAEWRRHDLSSMRKILHAAAPCPVPLKQQVMDVFRPGVIWEYYGMSEGMGTVISPEEWLRKPGSVGRAFPGLDVTILDDDGTELPTGEIGLIYVSAIPGYRFGYHNAPEKTGEAWRGDYFTVGDLGRLDEDGYLFIADRRIDLIISGGVNVYPAEVEQALAALPDVVDAAVFGVPDERMGQRVHAVVELRDGAQRSVDDLLTELGESLARFKVPRSVELVDRLPREPNGKVLKRRLRDDYLSRTTVS